MNCEVCRNNAPKLNLLATDIGFSKKKRKAVSVAFTLRGTGGFNRVRTAYRTNKGTPYSGVHAFPHLRKRIRQTNGFSNQLKRFAGTHLQQRARGFCISSRLR